MKKYLMILLVLAGCEKIKEGTVIEKFYEPERTYKERILFRGIQNQFKTIHDDEDFVIIIQKKVDGKLKTSRYELTKKKYNDIKIGDYVRFK